MNACEHCPQYQIDKKLMEPERCYECGKISSYWIQGEDGTFGMRCSKCGAEAWADLNTPCEMDDMVYQISLQPFEAKKEDILMLSKMLKKSALETKKLLVCGELMVSGRIKEIFGVVSFLENNNYSYQASPQNPVELYSYHKNCRYPYRIR